MFSHDEKIRALEQQVNLLQAELEQHKEANRVLQQQYQQLKVQNERLLRKEAEHQSGQKSLIHKRIILSHAVILVPEHMIVGDRLENSTIKIYRGNNLTVTDQAELINCKIICMDEYSEDKAKLPNKPVGTIEIKGFFHNTDPQRFAISTHDRVLISPGARVKGNICAGIIVVNELTRVSGRLASRELFRNHKPAREVAMMEEQNDVSDEEIPEPARTLS